MSESKCYLVASKMVDLAGDCFQANDDSLNDTGFTLLDMARYLVKDTVSYLEYVEEEAAKKFNSAPKVAE
jgi:hypothetical protein